MRELYEELAEELAGYRRFATLYFWCPDCDVVVAVPPPRVSDEAQWCVKCRWEMIHVEGRERDG